MVYCRVAGRVFWAEFEGVEAGDGMRLLDLFCGAGGAAMGYYRAGFTEIVGIDIEPQPRYPFTFVRADALEYLAAHGHEFDAIHASPPCQAYSVMTKTAKSQDNHPDLVARTRELLKQTDKPYIIENVVNAPLQNPLLLCGTMFGLKVVRHRLFETSPLIWFPPFACCHDTGGIPRQNRGISPKGFISIAGHINNTSYARLAMGIDWMTGDELSQAIPPAYTEWIGRRILTHCV